VSWPSEPKAGGDEPHGQRPHRGTGRPGAGLGNQRDRGTGQLQLFALPDAEQLIKKYGVWVERGHQSSWLADTARNPFNRQPGETRTIAVFRAVVFAKRGATVNVPAELIQQ